MIEESVKHWVNVYPLSPVHIDCATAVMLKILDGKCKMATEEKQLMALLYDQVKGEPGKLLANDIHELITIARDDLNDEMRQKIYEKRVLAETMISRPIMKAFKAMIRQQGLFADAKSHLENA